MCSEDTRVYTGSGETSLRSVYYCLCYRNLVCSRGYKQMRGKGSQVSSGRSERVLRARLPLSRVLVSCSCVQIPLFMGRSAFPFIGEAKARVTDEEKEKNEREESFQGCRVLLLHADSADPVDVNRDDSMSWPCSSLAPCTGVICQSWLFTLSRWMSW